MNDRKNLFGRETIVFLVKRIKKWIPYTVTRLSELKRFLFFEAKCNLYK
jgi:hypothetical protein